MNNTKKKALEYHSMKGVPGKIEVVPTKPCATADDLSLAYTPGVAVPVLEIEKNELDAYSYTNKGNLVAVVSNGTAILGLGDIGALDVGATDITEGMKLAAAKSLAALAKEDVPKIVTRAYGGQKFSFGRDYIVPKPFDPRVIVWEAVAVARAACDEEIAKKPIADWEGYRSSLRKRMEKYWN